MLSGKYKLPGASPSPRNFSKRSTCRHRTELKETFGERLEIQLRCKLSCMLSQTTFTDNISALGGFLLALTPLSNILLGWRHSGLFGASDIAAYLFFGGVLMIIGGVLEFVLGNTFPSVVFTTFGAFWLTYGGRLHMGCEIDALAKFNQELCNHSTTLPRYTLLVSLKLTRSWM